MQAAEQPPRTLTLAALPQQPPPAEEAQTLTELLDDDLARFAMTFDGYEQFGEHWGEVLLARQEEWAGQGTLPRDVDALRGLLQLAFRRERFLELDDPQDPDRILAGRLEHERFKHAVLAKLRTLLAAEGAA